MVWKTIQKYIFITDVTYCWLVTSLLLTVENLKLKKVRLVNIALPLSEFTGVC